MAGGGVDARIVGSHIGEWQPIGAEELDGHLNANWTPSGADVVAQRGRGWTTIVDLSGRSEWTGVVAHRGGRWTEMWTEVDLSGRPEWTDMGCHLDCHVGVQVGGMWSALKREKGVHGAAVWAPNGRGFWPPT